MNVNDLLCVGARPVSLVDYIAVEKADAAMLDGIAIGLAEGARQSNISITGGEISQLRDVVRGFDLVGTAVGTVPLDRILVGRDIAPGDRVIGIASSGIHSNGMTLTRRVLFDEAGARLDTHIAELGCTLGEELLRPTFIYVPEILDVLDQVPSVKALAHITGDGLLNLPRVEAEIGFVIDDLPPPPPLFGLIEKLGGVAPGRDVRGLQHGDRILRRSSPRTTPTRTLAILARHGRRGSGDRPRGRRPDAFGAAGPCRGWSARASGSGRHDDAPLIDARDPRRHDRAYRRRARCGRSSSCSSARPTTCPPRSSRAPPPRTAATRRGARRIR